MSWRERRWIYPWIVTLVVAGVAARATDGGGLYKIEVAEEYVAFSGNLEARYSYPANVSLPKAFVRLAYVRPGGQGQMEITTMGLRMDLRSGSLQVACGVVEFAGRFTLQMFMYAGGPMLTETFFTVTWPRMTLTLPSVHSALSRSVQLNMTSEATCNSLLKRQEFHLYLYTQRRNITSGVLDFEESNVVHTMTVEDITRAHVQLGLPCNVFDLDGSYQAVLKSTFDTEAVVTRSNVMQVTWSLAYQLRIRTTSIFPCQDSVDVYYSHPMCSGTDNIRLYLLRRQVDGSLAAPLERVYVIERHAPPDMTSVTFNCSLFEQEAAGFCFVYVSVGTSGAVQEQKHLCLAAHPHSVLPVDGNWSEWTAWGECTVTCGTGQRNRLRTCTNPAPQHGGRFCPGHTVEWKSCSRKCPEVIPTNPLRQLSVDPACACGCIMTSDSGEIIASGRCPGSAVWTVVVSEKERVKLTFKYFKLYPKRQWVKVRNGDSLNSDLLLTTSSASPDRSILSSGNRMLIELSTSYPPTAPPVNVTMFEHNASLPIHAYGFIAIFSTESGGGGALSSVVRESSGSVLDNTVALVGIVLCVLIVLVAVAFAVFHRLTRQRYKYAMAASDSPAHQQRPPSSLQSSQPSSPARGFEVIDMEVPLTATSSERKKKDSTASGGGLAPSRGSSISSTCSAGLKKLRSRKDSGPPGGGSPKPSSRDYTPLPSPYAQTASPEDGLHDANFFRASPVLRGVKPRSPKVHPSNKIRHAAQIACPPSPTKHDLLVKKRQQKRSEGENGDAEEADSDGEEEDRVVTGSSGSSSRKQVTSPVTPKAASGAGSLGAASDGSSGISGRKAEGRPARTPTGRELERARTPGSVASMDLRTPVGREPDGRRTPSSREGWEARTPVFDGGRDARTPTSRDGRGARTPTPRDSIPLTRIEERRPVSPTKEPARNGLEGVEETTSFIEPSKARRPTSLVESYSQEGLGARPKVREVKGGVKDKSSSGSQVTANEERQSLLPKPDGQSPKSPTREDHVASKGSTPRSTRSGRSLKTLSPTRSLATPSEAEGLELEYDDFIEDDPLSYFDPEELHRLKWTGVERIGKTPKDIEEEED